MQDNQSSCLTRTLNVSGASKLEFNWGVSSEEGGDYLKFYIDSDANDGVDNYTEIRSISGEINSNVEHIIANTGDYNLRWCYEKNASGAAGQDSANLNATLDACWECK